jgi:hypothetical protein
MIKILKNSTNETLNILGILVDPGQQINISTSLWAKLADSPMIHEKISSGEIIINNGKVDLNPVAGLIHIKLMKVHNFAYNNIQNSAILEIDNNQQMTVFGDLSIKDDSSILLDGELVVSDI